MRANCERESDYFEKSYGEVINAWGLRKLVQLA